MSSRKVPLSRPEPVPGEPLSWPAPCVAVFGADEGALAEALLETWEGAARLDVALRHGSGAEITRAETGAARIDAQPEALPDALEQVARERGPSTPTVGVGGAFAAAVRADVLVFSGPITAIPGLPPALRAVAREATLVLDEPREETMRALGVRLVARGPGAL